MKAAVCELLLQRLRKPACAAHAASVEYGTQSAICGFASLRLPQGRRRNSPSPTSHVWDILPQLVTFGRADVCDGVTAAMGLTLCDHVDASRRTLESEKAWPRCSRPFM